MTLLLMVLGWGSAAGSSSPACPTSSPAEIMEQRLSNRHPGLAAPGPVQLWSPHCVLAAWGAAGLGRSAWERGMQIAAGGWFSAFFLGRERVETQRNSAKPAALWVWWWSGTRFSTQVQQCWELLELVKEILLSWKWCAWLWCFLEHRPQQWPCSGKVSSPGVAGWLCSLQACSCCSGPWSWWGDSKTSPHKALPLWACCLYTNKYMCLQVNPPFLCEQVDLLTTLSMLWHLLVPTGEQQLTASPLQLVSDIIILIPD